MSLDKISTYANLSFGSFLFPFGRKILVKHLLLSLRGVLLLLLPLLTLQSNDQEWSRTIIHCDTYLRSLATRAWFATKVHPIACGIRAIDLMCRAQHSRSVGATGPHFYIATDLRSWTVVFGSATSCMSVPSHH